MEVMNLLQNLLIKAKNERILSETNMLSMRSIIGPHIKYKKSSEILKAIDKDALELKSISNDYERKKQDIIKNKSSLNRLYMEIQKQTILNTKLKNIKNKTKKEYESELSEYNMNIKRRLESKFDGAFKKAAKKDKSEFINQQMKIVNQNSANQRTRLFSKIKENDDAYRSSCKTLLIICILSNNTNNAVVEYLMDRNLILKKRFCDSVKNLKTVLFETKLCMSDILLRFDSSSYYAGVDKIEILQLTASTFELLITGVYKLCLISKAKVSLQQAKLWTTTNVSGKSVNFRSPLRRRATFASIECFSSEVSSPQINCFISSTSQRNESKNNSMTDEGFESLILLDNSDDK